MQNWSFPSKKQNENVMRNRVSRLAALLLLLPGPLLMAQDAPALSGAVGFFGSRTIGSTDLQPVIDPLVAAPIGQHLLAEARFDIREGYFNTYGTSGYPASFYKSTQFLQLDYIANPKLIVVAGRFLIPFGMYNERLSAIWIQNFQDAPILFSLGTRTTGSGDGGEVRGSAYASAKVQVSYLGYFSVRSNVGQFQAARAAGERVDVYFPGKRLEIGSSYARFLQQTQYNTEGAHFSWLPWRSPLQVRAEYAHGAHAQGYWIENSYRLSQWHGPDSVVGRFEPLFRMQQTFRNSPGNGDGLPSVDTKQADFGFDYHFPHEVRLNSSFGQKFSTKSQGHIWEISLTYRFLSPLSRGTKS